MSDPVRMACEPTILMIPLEKILPTRIVEAPTKRTTKYRCIAASIRELGLIEPLVVHPQTRSPTAYMLLDGHIRLEILRDLGEKSAKCLISTDDEAFTYNRYRQVEHEDVFYEQPAITLERMRQLEDVAGNELASLLSSLPHDGES